MIPAELVAFFESGLSIQVGTRNASLFPEDVRAMGCRVDSEKALTVFVPEATGAQTVANIDDNARIAVCFARPFDHRTIQVKGTVTGVRLATPSERPILDRYRAGLVEELGAVGALPRITLRLAHWPCHAVSMVVQALFEQTPGPGAGDPLRPAREGKR